MTYLVQQHQLSRTMIHSTTCNIYIGNIQHAVKSCELYDITTVTSWLADKNNEYRLQLEMWANAQRDGRPVEHRWRAPSVQRCKVWLTPTTRCRAETLPRRETHSNLEGCPKLVNRSQPLLGRSSPYYEDMWRTYCSLTSFFPIVDMCLSCEDIARQSCAMVPRW